MNTIRIREHDLAKLGPDEVNRYIRRSRGEAREVQLYVWWKSRILFAHRFPERDGIVFPDEQTTVGLAAYRVGVRGGDEWGRYSTLHFVHTMPHDRHGNIGTSLVARVRATAAFEGAVRMKTIVGSYSGVRLLARFGFDFWGVNSKGELVVDSPLVEREWPSGIPAAVESRLADTFGVVAPLPVERLREILLDREGIFRVTPEEAAAVRFGERELLERPEGG